MIVRNQHFEPLSGQTVRYDRKANSGNVSPMNFCAHCHGWVWNDPAIPGIKVVRAGTLDTMDWAEPIGNIWTDRKPDMSESRPGIGQLRPEGGRPDASVRRLEPA
jgi:hypothetical protein